jgi:hypothetical protein
MPEREVCSPVSRPGSPVGSNQPKSPGAFSSPSRGPKSDSIRPQPSHTTSRDSEEPATATVIGPEE